MILLFAFSYVKQTDYVRKRVEFGLRKENDGKIEHRGSGNYSSDKDKEIVRLKKESKDT